MFGKIYLYGTEKTERRKRIEEINYEMRDRVGI